MTPSQQQISDFLASAADEIGVEEITQFAEANSWLVETGTHTIAVFYAEVRKQLHFQTALGCVPEGKEALSFEMLLRFNRMWDDTGVTVMSIDGDENEVLQFKSIALPDLDAPTLARALREFAEMATSMSAIIENGFEESGDAPSLSSSAETLIKV